jgi:D-amino peptidase
VKVYFSVDMEGVACIIHPVQVLPPSLGPRGGSQPDALAYERGRKLLTGEVKAAVDGAYEAGATCVVVNEAHGTMHNILVEELDPRVRVIVGSPKPLCMAEGLDSSFDAAIFIGYHAPWKTLNGVMGHNYTGTIRLNGAVLGETGINAAVAGVFGVPVVMVSGDHQTTELAAGLLGPNLVQVPVKEGLGYMAADSLHPQEAQTRIKAGVIEALTKESKPKPYVLAPPITLDMEFLLPVTGELAALVPGVRRIGTDRVEYVTDDYLEAYRLIRLFLNLANVTFAA